MRKTAGKAWIFILIAVFILGVIFLVRAPATKAPGNQSETAVPAETSQYPDNYVAYSPEALAAASDKIKLLFFHAAWCPFCRAAEADILSRADELPDNLVIFKTDYDTQTALKQKYGITYQHTFVLIDNQGNQIKQWNGGGVDKILAEI